MDELKSLRKENPSENKILGISRDYSKRSFLNESGKDCFLFRNNIFFFFY